MTMADTIAVMNKGRIEQLGGPTELYERPRTAFVAGFLGISNLLPGTATGDGRVRLAGAEVQVMRSALAGRTGRVAVGIRPEKIHFGEGKPNRLTGTVRERAYIGVSTQYIVDTPPGRITVYVQNTDQRATTLVEGDPATLSWSPEATFVVDITEEGAPNDQPSDP